MSSLRKKIILSLLGVVALSAIGYQALDARRKWAAVHTEHGHSHSPGENGHEHEVISTVSENEVLPPGVIPVPAAVRSNLGITFATVEPRRVQETIRLPGRFELQHSAVAEYRAMGRGRVEYLVEQYQMVEKGTPLFTLSTPEWTILLQAIREAEEDALLVMRQREAQETAVEATEQAVQLWEERVSALEKLREEGGGLAAQLTQARAELARAKTEHALATARMREVEHLVHAIHDEVTGKNPMFLSAISTAALFLGVPNSWLLEEVDGEPRWYGLRNMAFEAKQAGIVDKLEVTRGGIVDDAGLILTTIDPRQLRFRGFALQTHLHLIATGQEASIVPPLGSSSTYSDSIPAIIGRVMESNPDERTFDIVANVAQPLPGWARQGASAFLEVVVAGSDDMEFAIPLSAVVQDGLEKVFFLRDRNNPDHVRRIVADLGVDDGRWIVVNSGVRPGDQVVLEGVYEIKQSSQSGPMDKGGHIHSDGTFHADAH